MKNCLTRFLYFFTKISLTHDNALNIVLKDHFNPWRPKYFLSITNNNYRLERYLEGKNSVSKTRDTISALKANRDYFWVKLDGIDIDTTLKELELTLAQEKELSPALRSMIGVLILIVKRLTNRIGLNSSNSSKPPSSDPNRKKKTRKSSKNKAGGQKRHPGTTLKQVDDPDEVETIKIDRKRLPKGHDYHDDGFETRQVFDIEITRMVTEYRAQVLVDENGKRFVASFPSGVTKAVQ